MNKMSNEETITIEEQIVREKYDLVFWMICCAEDVPVKGDPSWVGWGASVDMKGRILTALINAAREKGLDIYRR